MHTGLSIQHIPGKENIADPLSRPYRATKSMASSCKLAMPIDPDTDLDHGEDSADCLMIAPIAARKPRCSVPSKKKRGRQKKVELPKEHEATTETDSPPGYESSGLNEDSQQTQELNVPASGPQSSTPDTSSLVILRRSEIIEAQRKDKETRSIISWLKNKQGSEPVPGAREFIIKNGILYSPRTDIKTSSQILRFYIPASLRTRSIEAEHTVAHVAYDVTIRTLENMAYWPSFRMDVKRYLSKCLICKEKSTTTNNTQFC